MHLVEVGLAWPPEPFLARKLEGLAAAGLRVTVFTAADLSRARLSGVEARRLRAPGVPGPAGFVAVLRDAVRLLLRDARSMRRVLAVLRPAGRGASWGRTLGALRAYLPILLARPDVVHFEWESAAVRMLPLFEVCDCPVVVSVRGSGVNVHPYAGFEDLAAAYPAVFEAAAAVHCVSDAVRVQAGRFGLDGSKARVIHPGVDAGLFVPTARSTREPPGALRVVAVGELNWIKGYDDAVAAIAILVGEGVPVSFEVLGGEPAPASGKASDRPRLLYLIGDLGLQDHVRLLGEVSEEGVRERLAASDVLLQASLSEGLPNSVLEAMACALPVVVTDCGGLREAVEHGVEGLVCPRRDPEALAGALLELWRDPALARRLGQAGRARIATDFTLDRQLQSFTQLYEELAAVSPARRR